MILTNEQIKNITVGAVHTEENEGELLLFKYTPEILKAWTELDASFTSRARASTGIRFDFHTNSKQMTLKTTEPGKFEIYVNGLFRYTMKETDNLTVTLDTPRGQPLEDAHVTVYFPAHKHGRFISLELDDGAYVTPHVFDRRILFLGDSITQGWASQFDSLSFANKVSRYFNAESVVQGIGGACFFPHLLEPIPFDPDWVIVAYGTNDFNRYSTLEEFLPFMREYMEKLKGIYGDKQVFVISPIWRRLSKPEARERFEEYRRAIEAEATKQGYHFIDGSLLVPPVNELYTDGLHPADTGFSIYADNLIEVLREYAK